MVVVSRYFMLTFVFDSFLSVVLYLHDNNFDDGTLKSVCDSVETRRTVYPGYLQYMTADCKSSNIACDCCSQCY